jgi:hypothetical protein
MKEWKSAVRRNLIIDTIVPYEQWLPAERGSGEKIQVGKRFWNPVEDSKTLSLEYTCAKKYGDHEKGKKDKEEHLRDICSTFRYPTESKNGRDDSDDEKYNRPA